MVDWRERADLHALRPQPRCYLFVLHTKQVALCQLYVNGSHKGLHWFIVPLRSRETGELLPGVSTGHLGPKSVSFFCLLRCEIHLFQGRPGLDNGWIQVRRFCCISSALFFSFHTLIYIAFFSSDPSRVHVAALDAGTPFFCIAIFCTN